MSGKSALLFLFAPLFWRRKASAQITIRTTAEEASSHLDKILRSHNYPIENFANSPDGIQFVAKHGASFYSYGEKIKLGIREVGNGYCTINCTSSCIFPQWVDYGINKKNVTALLGGLSNELKDYSKPIFKS